MYRRLPAVDKVSLINRVESGEKIAKVCREAKISRTILYKWLKICKRTRRKDKSLALSQVSKRKPHWKSFKPEIQRKIIKFTLNHPYLSPAKISENLHVSAHGVWNVLKRNGLNTKSQRERYIEKNGKSLVIPRLFTDKITMLRRFEDGENVSSLCREFAISRTIFYRWFNRYRKAHKNIDVLQNLRPRGENHWRSVPGIADIVLEIVFEHPEFSVQRIAEALTLKTGKRLLGIHGVYNILKRQNLNTLPARLAYSKTKEPLAVHIPERARWEPTIPIFGKIPGLFAHPPPFKVIILSFAATLLFSFILFSLAHNVSQSVATQEKIGLTLSFISLFFGMFFFLYSLKYYLTIATVLSFSRHVGDKEVREEYHGSFWSNLFGKAFNGGNSKSEKDPYRGGGLGPDLADVYLERKPFVSIHIATYNEKNVVERVLNSVTSIKYENYEVIVVDDSNDETRDILAKWASHPRVKIIHREARVGFKGGALREALKSCDPRAEFVLVFDADFIPYPDTISQFLKYFQSIVGGLEHKHIKNTKIAAIQGYQWHVLNKSENWVTRGVRSEYSGSYVIERSGTEIYSGLKQIAGSVYMVRRDLLDKIGWDTSITEDFQLTLKLYEQGYKVIYTPYIQSPAEAVSTVKRLIRQRMRWAEGHSHNIKKMFMRLLRSPKLTLSEKLEFLYLSPYYLQAFFFIVGSLSWFLADAVFHMHLPFWTEVWGWSLVFTNLLALPLMNLVGLFMEESEEKDYLGLFSFVALSYLIAPFQAYAAIKGFIEREEGPWFRTPKTGRITDIFTPGRFYRLIFGVFRRPQPAVVNAMVNGQWSIANPYLALATANNRFENFSIKSRKGLRWVGKLSLVLLLCFTTGILYLSRGVSVVYATNIVGPLKLGIGSADANTWPSYGNDLENGAAYAASGANLFIFNNTSANTTGNNYSWFTTDLPTGGGDASIPSGAYSVNLVKQGGPANANTINYSVQLLLTAPDGTSPTQLLGNGGFFMNNSAGTYGGTLNVDNAVRAHDLGTLGSAQTITTAARKRLMVRIYLTAVTHNTRTAANLVINNTSARSELILPADITVPEIPKTVVFIIFIGLMPAIPMFFRMRIERGRKERKGKGWGEEFNEFLDKLTGRKEVALDELPV